MATYDLRQKTNASTGQEIIPSDEEIRIQKLENKVASQTEKLDQIVAMLNDLSKSKPTS
jgi:dephospho-CoA kinase